MEHAIQTKSTATVAQKKEKSFFAPAFVQPKLSIGAPNDSYEQEADAMADKVMRMSDNNGISLQPSPLVIQKKCAACAEEEKKLHRKEVEEDGNILQKKPIANNIVQRKCAACEAEERKIRRKESSTNVATAEATVSVHQALQSGGQKLDQPTRSFMESRFGYDFSHVQIHDDALAHQSSSDINALAYTHGNHIVFGAGQYQPQTNSGKQLLAHELTHVVQQQLGIVSAKLIQCKPTDYKQVTWNDFNAKGPSDPKFKDEGAEISTGFHHDSPSRVVETPKKKKKKCPKSNEFEYDVLLSIDFANISLIQPFMEPDLSWVSDRAKTNGVQYCKTELVPKCEKDVSDYTTGAKRICDVQVTQCENSYKGNPNNTFRYEVPVGKEKKVAVAYQKNQCSGSFLEQCIAAHAAAYKSAYDGRIKEKKECTTFFLPKCLQDEIQNSRNLLRHEQGHFDITKVFADKARQDATDKFAKLPKTVTGCGAAEATKNADTVWTDFQTEITTTLNAWDKLRDDAQDKYDALTVHGTNLSKQADWEVLIKGGLTDYKL